MILFKPNPHLYSNSKPYASVSVINHVLVSINSIKVWNLSNYMQYLDEIGGVIRHSHFDIHVVVTRFINAPINDNERKILSGWMKTVMPRCCRTALLSDSELSIPRMKFFTSITGVESKVFPISKLGEACDWSAGKISGGFKLRGVIENCHMQLGYKLE